MVTEVDALLERLVAQFASPYDFLRELVQNAMDAGADRVEVTLETHPAEDGDPDRVVFELAVLDTGAGMDETIIDGELTRLFGTSKAGDRTLAGGFGIGFVSVFAWEPERILLQTGRAGESWELLFHADRQFEKVPVDQPVEGTAVHLFRSGRAGERPAIAEAIRDALWRWCRFVPLEVSFEDLARDDGPELIQDAPDPDAGELGLGWSEGETQIQVAFDVPTRAVLLRHGLVLEEGGPAQLFPGLADRCPTSLEHLQVRVDSPRLRTTLARDKVVDDVGRAHVEGQVQARLAELREKLVARIQALTAAEGPWDRRRHHHYAHLQAHLALERSAIEGLGARSVLRARGPRTSLSLERLQMKGRPGSVCIRSPPGPLDPGVALALRRGLPVVLGEPRDRGWLDPLLDLVGYRAVGTGDGLTRVEPSGDAEALAHDLRRVFREARHPISDCQIGSFVDADDPRGPLWGVELARAADGEPGLAAFGVSWRSGDGDLGVWLNRDHPAVAAALRLRLDQPRLAAAALAMGLGALARGDGRRDAADLARAVDEVLEVPA